MRRRGQASEDPSVTVCLLEAGPSDVDDQAILRLEDWMYLLDSGYDWDYPVEPQEKGNSFLRHARAKVLGGCSSHNSCIAFWTPAEDLDEWAAMGCEGWSAGGLLAAIRRLETNDGPGDQHGHDGPVNIRTSRPTTRAASAVLEAAAEVGLPTVASTRATRSPTEPAGSRSTPPPTTRGCPPRTRTCTRSSTRRPNLEVRTHCWVKRDRDRRAAARPAVEYLTPDL